MATNKRPDKLGPQTRAFKIRDVTVDTDKRTATFSFSSEEPVDTWYGTEILSHAKGAMRTGVRQQNMPLLFNHDMDDLLGVIENVTIEGSQGVAGVRFGKDQRGDWAMNQYADGILRNASFLYRVFKYEVDEDEDPDLITATDWEPYEISLVTVPADATVGQGRAATESENNVTYLSKRGQPPSGVLQMTPEEIAAAEAASRASKLAQPAVDLAAIRQEAASAERTRVSEIMGLAGRFGLGQDFVERHRREGSTVEQVRAAALDAVEVQQRDANGIQAREQTRISEIEAVAKRHGMPEEFVKKHVTEKTSIENVRGLVLEYVGARGGPARPLSDPSEGIPAAELARFSIRKAILACLSNDWQDAGFEREVSNHLQKSRKLKLQGASGFVMPTTLPFQVAGAQRSPLLGRGRFGNFGTRAEYAVGAGATGGNLVGTELLADSFIEVLRNMTVTGQLGAQYLSGLVENINIPRQNAQTQTYWVGESSALTEAEATFDQVQLRPHVVGALSKMSRLTLQQTTPAIEQLVRNDLLMVSALAIDAAALFGTGSSSQPTGIANTTNVGSVVGGTNGANWTFDEMVQLYAAPLVANAPQENLAFAINAKTKGYLATLKSSTGQYLWNPTQSIAGGIPADLVGYRYAVSNQLPYNLTKGTATTICSMAMFGNWQELLIGEWGVTEIMVNPYDSTGFADGDVSIRVFQTVDIGLRHPQSFAVMSDGLTPGF
jgi:HK97 family phage major capsid protein/HK97 family phage prohead protease